MDVFLEQLTLVLLFVCKCKIFPQYSDLITLLLLSFSFIIEKTQQRRLSGVSLGSFSWLLLFSVLKINHDETDLIYFNIWIIFYTFLKYIYSIEIGINFQIEIASVVHCVSDSRWYVIIILGTKIYDILMDITLYKFSSSFTFGVSVFISQGIAMYALDCVMGLLNTDSRLITNNSLIYFISQYFIIGFLVLFLILSPVISNLYSELNTKKKVENTKIINLTIIFYSILLMYILLFLFPFIYIKLNVNFVTWLLTFLFNSTTRIILLIYWVLILLITLIPLFSSSFIRNRSHTISRKYFHLIVLLLFVPPIVYDVLLVYFSFSVALVLFVLIEVIRTVELLPVGKIIKQFMNEFIDEKDNGILILTHIYLLLGCAIPVWVAKNYNLNPLLYFSGLLTIGIGDSAASICGTYFGKHKWLGTKKSVEGTLGFVISAFISILLLSFLLGVSLSISNLLFILASTTLVALLEAFTFQVDNLFLPVYYLSFLCLILD